MMSNGPQAAAFDALTDLVNTSRRYRDEADRAGRPGWTQTWDALALHLDRSRTRLVEEGEDYLTDAWAIVDAGRLTVARHIIRVERMTRR
jgi:hypothetical protein